MKKSLPIFAPGWISTPVTVRLRADYPVVPIVDSGDLGLEATATMRVELPPTRYAAGACP